MRVISSTEYNRLSTPKFQWSGNVSNELPSSGKRERLIWMLDTARIDYQDHMGGSVEFDELISRTVEFEPTAATGGLKVNRFHLEDLDGGGVQQATEWSRQIGQYAAYWKQKQIAKAVRMGAGTTVVAYDGLSFFNAAHPLNPFDSTVGTYSNVFTGVDISTTVTLDVAFTNFQSVIKKIADIKMPNGVDPRFLRINKLIVPPALAARAQQLTNAKFVAQAAASGGGSADVEAMISNWGIGQPIQADELGAAITDGAAGSDTAYYVVCDFAGSDQLGALTYVNREAFQVIYNDQMTDAQLARANELQWMIRGRNVVGYGHPYLLFKCGP